MTDPTWLEPTKLTWTVLLARWMQFARSALALPRAGDGVLMRDSVADVIALQAVWFALRHLEELPPAERALGLDRAAVLIEKHGGALEARWGGAVMPAALSEVLIDTRHELAAARSQHQGPRSR